MAVAGPQCIESSTPTIAEIHMARPAPEVRRVSATATTPISRARLEISQITEKSPATGLTAR